MPNWGGGAIGAGSGALTGAELGTTVFPGIGTAVGAGLGAIGGGLMGLFHGGKKKTTMDPDLEALVGSLKTNAGSAAKQGADLSAQGTASLTPILDYFKKLAGGDASSLASATAPARRRVIDQYDTARKAISTFSPRGGGSNAALASSQFGQANELSDITSNAQNNAANELGTLGIQEQGLGVQEQGVAGSDLNSIVSAILGSKGLDITKSGQNAQLAGGISEGLGTLLGLYLTKGKAAGAGAGT